eukprot:9173771-Pyramimonas_sp.AAC.1
MFQQQVGGPALGQANFTHRPNCFVGEVVRGPMHRIDVFLLCRLPVGHRLALVAHALVVRVGLRYPYQWMDACTHANRIEC